MSDFNKSFDKNNEVSFFYNKPGYEGKKLVAGTVSLKNAIARLQKPFEEYYVLVTYNEGEQLPNVYVPLSGYESADGTLFATINPDPFNYRINDLCNYIHAGGIQRVSRIDMGLQDWGKGDLEHLVTIPEYLLGPGPETVKLVDLIDAEYLEYCKEHGMENKKTAKK